MLDCNLVKQGVHASVSFGIVNLFGHIFRCAKAMVGIRVPDRQILGELRIGTEMRRSGGLSLGFTRPPAVRVSPIPADAPVSSRQNKQDYPKHAPARRQTQFSSQG